MNVDIYHTVGYQKIPFQAFCKIDRGGTTVGNGVKTWFIENVGGIAMIIMGPVGNRAEGCSRSKCVGFSKQCHEGDETAVASSVDPNFIRINAMLLYQILNPINLVGKVFSSHMSVDPGSPVSSVTCTSSVIDVNDCVAEVGEEVVEHIFSEIT